ncbi:MAG: peptidyl-prolyl cis-trans isomerase [Bacillaceae bacterium]|nr:peptidyl-prolyl cis-trans isomerase [Bacillaceae bacterium]
MSKKWLWAIVGAVTVLMLAFFLIRQEENQEQRVVAMVGDQPIYDSEWVEELKKQHGETVLQKMIDHLLVYQEAERLGIQVTEDEIKLEMANLQEKYNSEDPGAFAEQMGMTQEQIEEELRYSMLLEELAMKDVHITDAEIEKYYEQNKALYKDPARVYLYLVVASTEEEAEEMIGELEGGTSFSSLIQERQADVLDLGDGGEIGWVTRDDTYIDPQILEEAFEAEVGEISGPIQTEYGYAVIQVTERTEERQKPLSEVKRDIRRELAFQQADPIPEILQHLREQAGVQILIDSADGP